MSFIHSQSNEGLVSQLDLFAAPITQTSVESGTDVHYKPTAALTDESPIEFVISGAGENYFDLSLTRLKLAVKITKRSGENLVADARVAPVNNWFDSLFSQVDIYLNQKLISPPSNAYAYRSQIESLLNYDSSAKKSHLTTKLWYQDTAGRMDVLDDSNLGFMKRLNFTSSSKTVDLIGFLHVDLFSQNRFMLNGVEMRVKLVRNKDAFHIMSTDDDVRAQITSATLIVRKVKINPSILLAHGHALEKGNALYPLTRVDIKSFTIGSGLLSKSIDNIYTGQQPKRVVVGFVLNTAFNGNLRRNPYNFQNFGINYLAFSLDGEQIPSKPLTPDFSSQYIDAYHTLFSGTGIHYQDEGNDISREDYPNGNCLMAFDLSPDLAANSDHWSLIRQGSLRMDVRFSTALSEAINCIIYAEFDNVLEIDRHRNIRVDYGS